MFSDGNPRPHSDNARISSGKRLLKSRVLQPLPAHQAKPINLSQPLVKHLQSVLTLIGGLTILAAALYGALQLMRQHAPDTQTELVSPDRRHRIVITEQLAGFPGATCIKQVYVVDARAGFDRDNEDNQVFSGACDGLAGIGWNGNRVEGSVALAAAVDSAQVFKLKGSAADGKVQLSWAER